MQCKGDDKENFGLKDQNLILIISSFTVILVFHQVGLTINISYTKAEYRNKTLRSVISSILLLSKISKYLQRK